MNYAKVEKNCHVVRPEEPCITVERLARMPGEIVERRISILGKKEARKFKNILVKIGNNVFKACADCITGTIYLSRTGECLSSRNLRLIRER